MSGFVINPYAFGGGGGGGGGAPVFIAANSVSYGTSNGAVVEIPLPAGVVENDIVLLTFSFNDFGTTVTDPSGVTLIEGQTTAPHSTSQLLSYWYRVPASPPPSLSFGLSQSANRRRGMSAAFRGVDTTSPIDASAAGTNDGVATHVAPSIVTTTDAAYIVNGWMAASDVWDAPYPGTTLESGVAAPVGNTGLLFTGETRASAGSGIAQQATSDAASNSAVHSIALKAA